MLKLITRIILVVAVLALGIYTAIWLAAQKQAPLEKETGERPLSVEAVPAAYAEFLPRVEGYGTARSARRVLISPEITGKVAFALFRVS